MADGRVEVGDATPPAPSDEVLDHAAVEGVTERIEAGAALPPSSQRQDPSSHGLGPLDAATRRSFEAIPSDPPPPSLTRNSHYWVSNEHSHFLWHDAIAGVGGGYVGVGTDQNYLLAAWARSEIVVLMDFDEAISDLHRVYGLLFSDAQTPEDFVASWRPDAAPHVEARIALVYADDPRREDILRAFRRSRKLVYARLRRVVRTYRKRGIGTFLTDREQYDHVRDLWRNGRVFPVRGDLTGDATMRGIARAFAQANVPVNVLYLSNAEQYFDYGPSFRRNIVELPFGPHAVVLRTLGWSGHGFVEGEEYHYNVQPGDNFATWMRTRRVRSAGLMLSRKRSTDVPGSSILDHVPTPSKRPPELAL